MSTTDRWKYLVVTVKGIWTGAVPDERLQTELNSQGTLGWELVNVLNQQSSIKLFFKKPA